MQCLQAFHFCSLCTFCTVTTFNAVLHINSSLRLLSLLHGPGVMRSSTSQASQGWCIALCRFYALKHGNRIFYPHGPAGAARTWLGGPEAEQLFNRWKAGSTGMPLVDANMRELALTGECRSTHTYDTKSS